VPTVLLATDADWIYDEVDAGLSGDHEVYRVRRGSDVLRAFRQVDPAVVLLDLQIGNMGGIAACLDLRLEQRAGRIPPARVLVLLDRDDDVFLARQAESDGWLVKPLDAFRLRRAVEAVLGGRSYTEGPTVTADAAGSA
jgi:DNA-binding response OmpR family regulator